MNANQIKKVAVSSEQREAAGCRPAFTLPEMLVTIGVVAIVAAMALPAFYAIQDGFSSNGADTLISAALSTAKAMAAKEQKYVGIRFQCVPNPDDHAKPGDQYMIFIIHDPTPGLPFANAFRAANGIESLKLPVNQGVMDLQVKENYAITTTVDKDIALNTDIDDLAELWDATTFSIVFSPAGRLVTHKVKVWNKDGACDQGPPWPVFDASSDMVFNFKDNVLGAMNNVADKRGMFYQDDDKPPAARPVPGLGQESSRKSFVIYDKRDLAKIPAGNRWDGYFKRLSEEERLYINPYTGTIIENQSRRNAMK